MDKAELQAQHESGDHEDGTYYDGCPMCDATLLVDDLIALSAVSARASNALLRAWNELRTHVKGKT